MAVPVRATSHPNLVMNPIYFIERLEPRRLLSGDVQLGDVVQRTIDGVVVDVVAGEWGVMLGEGGSGDGSPADGSGRSPELPPDAWLADALATLAASGIGFDHYLGLDTMFGVTAPVDMPAGEVERLLTHALPAVVAVEPNVQGSWGISEDAQSTSSAHAPAPRVGDAVQRTIDGATVNVRAGEWGVMLGEGGSGEGSPADKSVRSPELPPDGWLADALAVLAVSGIEFDHYLGLDTMFGITTPVDMPADVIENLLSAVIPAVSSIEPNLIGEWYATPSDAEYGKQWHLNNVGQSHPVSPGSGVRSGTPGADVDAEDAWSYSKGSFSNVVAVLDSGMDYTHEDLIAPRWRNQLERLDNQIDDDGNNYINDAYGYDFFDNDRDPMEEVGLGNGMGHGTAVAGVVGAHGDNTIGVSGIAQQTRILPIRVGDAIGPDLMAVTAGINYVNATYDAGANIDVINMSLGFSRASELQNAALEGSEGRGIIAVVSSPNVTVDLDDPAVADR